MIICSSDSDFIQLLECDNGSLWNPVKKSFVEKWPVDYLTWKALRGDKTDNVPGIKGVGDKTAMKLCGDSRLLEEFLSEEKRKIFESAYKQIKLSEIKESSKSFEINDYTFNDDELFAAFEKREFNSITGKGRNKWMNTMETLNEKRSAIQ